MKNDTYNNFLRLFSIGWILLVSSQLGWCQPAGWHFREFRMLEGQPGARLVHSASGEVRLLRSGDSLEEYQLLTANADRLLFRRGDETVSLLVEPEVAQPSGLSYRVGQLRIRRVSIRDLLEELSSQSRFRLVILGDVEGTLSVDFSNMTVREILDSLCSQFGLTYRTGGGTLWVMAERDDQEK